jgi:hypothetical protein
VAKMGFKTGAGKTKHGQLSSVYSISASVMCKFYFKIHILLSLLLEHPIHNLFSIFNKYVLAKSI